MTKPPTHQTTELLAFVSPPVTPAKLESLIEALQDNIAAAALLGATGVNADLEARLADLEARVDVASDETSVKGLARALRPSRVIQLPPESE